MEDLLDLWQKQKAAMAAPYDADQVQAWGLAFAYVYFELKDALCALCEIAPTEFSYANKYDVIAKLETMYVP